MFPLEFLSFNCVTIITHNDQEKNRFVITLNIYWKEKLLKHYTYISIQTLDSVLELKVEASLTVIIVSGLFG